MYFNLKIIVMSTINKEEIQKFSNLAKNGGMKKGNSNHYTCSIPQELNTY